jgi:hypothetical protein
MNAGKFDAGIHAGTEGAAVVRGFDLNVGNGLGIAAGP